MRTGGTMEEGQAKFKDQSSKLKAQKKFQIPISKSARVRFRSLELGAWCFF
jgi:hypothetical protein